MTEKSPGKELLELAIEVDTHWHSQWHFTGQAKLDLNLGVTATSHIQ